MDKPAGNTQAGSRPNVAVSGALRNAVKNAQGKGDWCPSCFASAHLGDRKFLWLEGVLVCEPCAPRVAERFRTFRDTSWGCSRCGLLRPADGPGRTIPYCPVCGYIDFGGAKFKAYLLNLEGGENVGKKPEKKPVKPAPKKPLADDSEQEPEPSEEVGSEE